MLTACTEDVIIEVVEPSPSQEYIYATINTDTRVELNELRKTVWTKGDMIIRYGDNIHDVWTFNGETGDRSGKFSKYGSFQETVNHSFNGKYIALYPYKENFYVGTTKFDNGDMAIVYAIGEEQNYHPNSYDPSSNIMLGAGKTSTNFEFHNLMGYLRLSLTGAKSVKKITLKGNNDEKLGGWRYTHEENVDIGGWYDSPTYTLTLNCGNGVQLTDEPTQFYFSLVPTTFTKGINVVIYFTDGTQYTVNTSKQVAVARNTIQPMANVNTSAEMQWQTITIKHRGERLSAPLIYDLTGSFIATGYILWGDNYMSDINTIGTYIYADAEQEHTITVKTQGGYQVYLQSLQGISEIDLSNF